MRKILGVCLLVLLLTCPAVAGEMPNGSPAPPPPPSAPQTGEMPNGSPTLSQPPSTEETTADGVMLNEAAASLAQVAWELFAVWPSLL